MRWKIIEAKRRRLRGKIIICENVHQMMDRVADELNEEQKFLKIYYEKEEPDDVKYLFFKGRKVIAELKEI